MTVNCAFAWTYNIKPILYEVNTFFEKNFIKSNTDNYRLIEVESTSRTILSPEIDAVFEECQKAVGVDDAKVKSESILYSSYLNMKEFAFYLKNLNVLPNVIPFKNDCLGFEWNYNNISIVIVFCGNNKYIYSIITDTINDYGENYQTEINQLNFIDRISGILKSA